MKGLLGYPKSGHGARALGDADARCAMRFVVGTCGCHHGVLASCAVCKAGDGCLAIGYVVRPRTKGVEAPRRFEVGRMSWKVQGAIGYKV